VSDPFADLLAALNGAASAPESPYLRIDPTRAARTGVPEIVFAERKTVDEVLIALRSLAQANGRALASRLTPEQLDHLGSFSDPGFTLEIDAEARMAIMARPGMQDPRIYGRIAVIAAGTSDRPVAREATLTAKMMGCEVIEIHDVGVAGLHRIVQPLRSAVATGIDAIVVAAGMDGALPSVVTGLVDVPVVGLPVSVGYGAGGNGEGALLAMLQSCAPGMAVVNIDNGIGAGSMAALIARGKTK
jgi:NCAIR mutase (PurE)-related protein